MIIIGIFVKMQHFQSKLLKNYQKIVMIMENAMLEYQLQNEDY